MNPSLRNQGGFIGVDAYKQLLAANGVDVGQFEDGVRFMLLSSKITNLLDRLPQRSRGDCCARLLRARTRKHRCSSCCSTRKPSRRRSARSEAELRKYFEANKDKYHIKEERRVQYLLLPVSEIASTAAGLRSGD